VNDYEILLMLDPESPEERHNEIIARTRELVEKGGGAWVSHDAWGRRRLAYEIDHKGEGTYHLLQFDAEPVTLNEIARVLKITDGVMRHMATRRPRGGGMTGAPPPLPPMEESRGERYEPRPSRSRRDEAEIDADTGADAGYPEPAAPEATAEPLSESEPEPQPEPEPAQEPEPAPEEGA
jgi:small subunit ribosomal protein S6